MSSMKTKVELEKGKLNKKLNKVYESNNLINIFNCTIPEFLIKPVIILSCQRFLPPSWLSQISELKPEHKNS